MTGLFLLSLRIKALVIGCTKIFLICFVLGGLMLFILQAIHGVHDASEEIVFLATPLLLALIGVRLFRIKTSPLSEEEERQASLQIDFHDVLTACFGVGVLSLGLILACMSVYAYFGIHWAVLVAIFWMKAFCLILVLLATLMLLQSQYGRAQLRLAVRFLMAVPSDFGHWFDSIVPDNFRFHAKRSKISQT